MLPITIRDFGPNQCEVLVGDHRVAYVCYGERQPINFLAPVNAGINLTDEEKLQVAEHVRKEMATRTDKKSDVSEKLASITSPNYQSENQGAAEQTTDSGSPGDVDAGEIPDA